MAREFLTYGLPQLHAKQGGGGAGVPVPPAPGASAPAPAGTHCCSPLVWPRRQHSRFECAVARIRSIVGTDSP